MSAYDEDALAPEPARPTVDALSALRSAAAVLASFDPVSLVPAGATVHEPAVGLRLLPELLRVTRSASGDPAQWALPIDKRRRELQRLGSREAMRTALAANPGRTQSPVQRMFERLLADDGPPPELTQLDHAELSALLPASQWLSGILSDVPDSRAVREELARRDEEVALRRLADGRFVGREPELERLRTHLRARPSGSASSSVTLLPSQVKIIFLCGHGGCGKSTLMAKLLLERAAEPQHDTPRLQVHIDLDHPACAPDRPLTLLTIAAAQLARRDPSLERLATHLSDQVARALADDDEGAVEFSPDLYGRQLEILQTFSYLVGEDPIPFIVDTFEEAQYLGAEVEQVLLRFIEAVASTCPGARVILSGRAAPHNLDPARYELIELPELPFEPARELLSRSLAALRSAPLPSSLLDAVTRRIGGNPLTLRLAAPLVAREGAAALVADDVWLDRIHVDAFQARLYARILGHIHDPDVSRLAVPGLIVRTLTPELIRDVLAEPCGLGRIDEARARTLFDELAREVALVHREPDGTLRHRSDVRRAMLTGMPAALGDKLRTIDERAIAFWSRHDGPRARAEELYHHLRCEHPADELDARWDPAAAPFLRSALDELPPASRARMWLANKLGVSVSSDERADVDLATWEQQAAQATTRLLHSGDPISALRVLRERSERTPASPIVALEARALLLLDRLGDAWDVLAKALAESARGSQPGSAVEWLLLSAWTAERGGQLIKAMTCLKEAEKYAIATGDPLVRAQVVARRLRVSRQLGVDRPAERFALTDLLNDIPTETLAGRPALVQEIAAELGGDDPDLLLRAMEIVDDHLFDNIDPERLAGVLRSASLNFKDIAESTPRGNARESLLVVRKWLLEALYAGDRHTLAAALSDCFKDAVQTQLQREFGGARASRRLSSISRTTAAQRSVLLNAMTEVFTIKELPGISKLYLSADLARIVPPNSSLQEAALAIVNWAERRGMTEELVRAVLNAGIPSIARDELLSSLTAGDPSDGSGSS
jgi:energy-coupling factor transporter ATP-binding protein EcfA2